MNSIRTRGKKSTPHLDPDDPPRRRANKRRGRGTYANDRPPIIGVINRETHECRYWVVAHADKVTSQDIIIESLPSTSTLLFTDEGTNYINVHPQHKTVCHGQYEWARDADGDGMREVHCNTCEGAGTILRTFLRPFRGVHKQYLPDYVATFETLHNAKRITPDVVQRMCYGSRLHASPT
jgi:transposase